MRHLKLVAGSAGALLCLAGFCALAKCWPLIYSLFSEPNFDAITIEDLSQISITFSPRGNTVLLRDRDSLFAMLSMLHDLQATPTSPLTAVHEIVRKNDLRLECRMFLESGAIVDGTWTLWQDPRCVTFESNLPVTDLDPGIFYLALSRSQQKFVEQLISSLPDA